MEIMLLMGRSKWGVPAWKETGKSLENLAPYQLEKSRVSAATPYTDTKREEVSVSMPKTCGKREIRKPCPAWAGRRRKFRQARHSWAGKWNGSASPPDPAEKIQHQSGILGK